MKQKRLLTDRILPGQSTPVPSAMVEATEAPGSSALALMRHPLRELDQRAADRHLRGGDAWLAERRRDVAVRQAEFYAGNDRLPVFRSEGLERPLVAVQRFAAQGELERGRLICRDV